MNQEDLAALIRNLRARLAAATQGKLSVHPGRTPPGTLDDVPTATVFAAGAQDLAVATCGPWDQQSIADAELIADALNGLPDLLDAAAALHRERARCLAIANYVRDMNEHDVFMAITDVMSAIESGRWPENKPPPEEL